MKNLDLKQSNLVETESFVTQHRSHWPDIAHKPSRSSCKNANCTGLTNVYCETCATYLCFTSTRNCFAEFHRNKFPKEHQHLPLHAEQQSRSRCHFNCHTPSNLTHVFCSECKVFLCFNHTRNCFKSYHLFNNVQWIIHIYFSNCRFIYFFSFICEKELKIRK